MGHPYWGAHVSECKIYKLLWGQTDTRAMPELSNWLFHLDYPSEQCSSQ